MLKRIRCAYEQVLSVWPDNKLVVWSEPCELGLHVFNTGFSLQRERQVTWIWWHTHAYCNDISILPWWDDSVSDKAAYCEGFDNQRFF